MDTDFDLPADFWDDLFNSPTPAPVCQAEQRIAQLRSDYLNSRFCKKWAATFEQARDRSVADYKAAKATLATWQAKEYKPNQHTIECGEYNRSIGNINATRRKKAMTGSGNAMHEALETLRDIGLTASEITDLIK